MAINFSVDLKKGHDAEINRYFLMNIAQIKECLQKNKIFFDFVEYDSASIINADVLQFMFDKNDLCSNISIYPNIKRNGININLNGNVRGLRPALRYGDSRAYRLNNCLIWKEGWDRRLVQIEIYAPECEHEIDKLVTANKKS